jgi:hypothetical protein
MFYTKILKTLSVIENIKVMLLNYDQNNFKKC